MGFYPGCPWFFRDNRDGTMKILNLYGGIGGNRWNWNDVKVTAVEIDPFIAELYRKYHPNDQIVVGDAHEYLVRHFREYDLIWSSPPCQTHSLFNRAWPGIPRYPDLRLYEEIILLRAHARKQMWIVENVDPYYDVLIKPSTKCGHHLFWCNFPLNLDSREIPRMRMPLTDMTTKHLPELFAWLGMPPVDIPRQGERLRKYQILRNCVHPVIGAQVLACARGKQIHFQSRDRGFGL